MRLILPAFAGLIPFVFASPALLPDPIQTDLPRPGGSCPLTTTVTTTTFTCPPQTCPPKPTVSSTVKVTVTVSTTIIRTERCGLKARTLPPIREPDYPITPTLIRPTETSLVEAPTRTFGPLCPHYCATTVYMAVPSPCTKPTKPCTKPVVTATCDWCPEVNCIRMVTKWEKWECPTATACKEEVRTVGCGEKSWPTGYQLTIS